LSICFHQEASAALLACRPSERQMRIMSSSTWAQSPTIGRSTLTFLLIDEGSMSMWILREPGENASIRPVMRSSKRAPMHSITSQSCMVQFAS
jgi:hypothetical protein